MQLRAIQGGMDSYDNDLNERVQGKSRKWLTKTLGVHYDQTSTARVEIFAAIATNIRKMAHREIVIDGPMPASSANPRQLVGVGANGGIFLTQGFFTDNTVEDWVRVYVLLRELFKVAVPKHAQKFALSGRNRLTGSFTVRPLFDGENSKLEVDEKQIDGYKDFQRVIDYPSGSKAVVFSVNVIPMLGYSAKNGGALPELPDAYA
ncbi:hypothetical protein CVT24_011740 [Panaeolus cyanescens]|uniref:Uncharacterized protein n=1 Tax=Panaeolus cyanescens TaxID=181874 RepID=A0A409YNM2_9AGAR|nr:hypothetical protein CVT24_011740 [Panaeolus cyanescens]